VLIVGASGRIGRELLRLLRRDGLAVRAPVRAPETQRLLAGDGVDVVPGDWRDPAVRERMLDDVSQLLVVTRDNPQLGELEAQLFARAAQRGVKHIVKISAFAAGLQPPPGYGLQHARSEQALRACGSRWTILRPYMFMQNFLDMAPLIARRGLFVFPGGNGRVALIDARDVAAAAHAALLSSRQQDRIFELTGPEALDFADCAAVFTRVLGRKVRYRSIPSWLAGLLMRADGVGAWDVRMRRDLFAMLCNGGEARVTGDFPSLTGAAPRTLSDFVSEHRDRFLAG
jgi:uncharacterized protein YbjT (DUF2867 family)